jgi:hypothetical protein
LDHSVFSTLLIEKRSPQSSDLADADGDGGGEADD